MEYAKRLVSTLEHLVSTKSKKHIVGGVLLSASIFLGGLALTAMSIKIKEESNEPQYAG
mgnify:CR=1 FL=1|jgi:hypothetical protein